MGMFDEVLCNHEIFGKHKGKTCQTKSLEPFMGGALEKYEISAAGRLEFLEYKIEDRSDPKAEGILRLAGSMAMVFTCIRRDVNYHGWLELEGIGRAKFTDGSIVGLEPWDENVESIEPGNNHDRLPIERELNSEGLKVGSELGRREAQEGGVDREFSGTLPPADPRQYLSAFFRELNRLKPPQSRAMSHAITYQRESLCVLISVGDCRRKVFVEEIDRDPVVAAEKALKLWERVKDGNSPSDFE